MLSSPHFLKKHQAIYFYFYIFAKFCKYICGENSHQATAITLKIYEFSSFG